MTALVPAFDMLSNPASISCGEFACAVTMFTDSFFAAVRMFSSIAACDEVSGLIMTATRESLGTIDTSISRSFGPISTATLESPVTLPPGRARL